jgi:hypothetical protein
MVCWKSASSLAVLLRVSRYPSKTIPKLTTTVHFTAAQKSSTPFVPTDDGDHDLDIDLITLRRRTIPDKGSRISGKNIQEWENERRPYQQSIDRQNKTVTDVATPPIVIATTLPEGKQSLSRTRDTKTRLQLVDQLANATDMSHLQASTPTLKGNQREGQGLRRGLVDTSCDNVDPRLVRYLKSIHSKPPKTFTRHIEGNAKPSRQDLDIEFLRPDDIRSNYLSRRQSADSDRKNKDICVSGVASGVAGDVPEHLVDAGIQHLKLTSSDANVVIPRPILVQLIEQTISLSGAAVQGDDVVIERYSPTWHRFARLLRTSDLHKISTLKPQASLQAPSTPKITDKTSEQVDIMDANLKRTVINPNASSKAEFSTPTFTEREYIILTLEAKKKRVVTTRFRRLLDLSSSVPIPSSEDLLKVESLNLYTYFQAFQLTVSCRYLPHLKHLDLEGFFLIAASESGIVLSRKLDSENVAGTHAAGWLRRFLKRRV